MKKKDKLLKLAGNAITVIEQNKDSGSAIAEFQSDLLPAARASLDLRVGIRECERKLDELEQSQHQESQRLCETLRAWIGPVGAAVKGHIEQGYRLRPEYPAELLVEAQNLLEAVKSAKKQGLADRVKAAIGPQIQALVQLAKHIASVEQTLQEQSKEQEKQLGVVSDMLVHLRRSVKAIYGTRSWQHRCLRVRYGKGGETEPVSDPAPSVTPVDGLKQAS